VWLLTVNSNVPNSGLFDVASSNEFFLKKILPVTYKNYAQNTQHQKLNSGKLLQKSSIYYNTRCMEKIADLLTAVSQYDSGGRWKGWKDGMECLTNYFEEYNI
jgi:hypothetical protein